MWEGYPLILDKQQRSYLLCLLRDHREQLDKVNSPEDFETRVLNNNVIAELENATPIVQRGGDITLAVARRFKPDGQKHHISTIPELMAEMKSQGVEWFSVHKCYPSLPKFVNRREVIFYASGGGVASKEIVSLT
jgi:hypothetical protein